MFKLETFNPSTVIFLKNEINYADLANMNLQLKLILKTLFFPNLLLTCKLFKSIGINAL